MQTLEQQKLENITLYYKEGSSDKVYQCGIEPAGERFVVNFQYGRRGSTLNTGTKTNVPVDFDNAKRIFDKLVKEKTGKGYTPGERALAALVGYSRDWLRQLLANFAAHGRDGNELLRER